MLSRLRNLQSSFRILEGERGFPLLKNVLTSSRAYPSSSSMGTGFFKGVKRPGTLNLITESIHLSLEGPCIIFAIYIHSNEIHNAVALVKCLLVLRCQLYMFRTVTVHPQELLFRYCTCRLW